MRKRFCLLPALALALLCACSKGAAKTPPTRPDGLHQHRAAVQHALRTATRSRSLTLP